MGTSLRRRFLEALIGTGLVGLGAWIGPTWIFSAAPPELKVQDIEAVRGVLSGSGRTDFFAFRFPLTGVGRVERVVLRYQGHETSLTGHAGVGTDWLFYSPLRWMDGGVKPVVLSFRPLTEEELGQFDEVLIYVSDPGDPGSGPTEWRWTR